MTKKEKATEGYAPTAASITITERNDNPIRGFIKTLIVNLAIRSLMPVATAEWLIQKLGLKGA